MRDLARASEQFRQSDVTLWGMVALACAGLAVFGANISALVPQSVLGGLHQPRLSDVSIETLRRQVSDLGEQTARLRRENETLLSRFALQEKSGNEVMRRVGALEVSLPDLLEAIPPAALVDRSSVTASIGADETLTFDADGGSVAVRRSALPLALPDIGTGQPLPAPLAPQAAADGGAYGIAVGAALPEEEAPGRWNDLSLKLGPLLFGLSPLLADAATGEDKRIVVGPFAEAAEAQALCQRFERVSISCLPMPYAGAPFVISP